MAITKMTPYEDIAKIVAKNLKCPICLDIFKTPVTLVCGHNYCQICIKDHFRNDKYQSCPQCRTKVEADLKKNVTLDNILELPIGGRALWEQVLSQTDEDIIYERRTGALTKDDYCFKNGDTQEMSSEEILSSSLDGEGASQYTDSSLSSQQSQQEDSLNEVSQLGGMEIMTHRPDSGLQNGTEPRASAGSAEFALLTFSPHLGHYRLVFLPDHRRVEVRRRRVSYGYFEACQCMADQEFTSGNHYWDVDTGRCTSWAVGVAYTDLQRNQRLGRSPTSWCIEWSSERLSAWHAGEETRLGQRRPREVRVLLKVGDGRLDFWSLEDGQLYSVQVEFRAPIRPVFWLFGTQEKNALSFPAP